MTIKGSLYDIKTRLLSRASSIFDRFILKITNRPKHYILKRGKNSALEIAILKYRRDVLHDVELKNCRALHPVFFTCGPHARNPFVETLRRVQTGEVTAYKGSPMQMHYSLWQPANVAQSIGLEAQDTHADLQKSHPFDFVFPWDFKRPIDVKRLEKIAQENKHFGYKDIGGANGHQCVGPVEMDKGQLEFDRFVNVYKSIRDNGFNRSDEKDGDLRGRILQDGGTEIVLITTGAHRAMALSALNFNNIPVRIYEPIVKRGMVAFWPNVKNGLFTKQQALDIFDRVIRGDWPKEMKYTPDDDLCGASIKNTKKIR